MNETSGNQSENGVGELTAAEIIPTVIDVMLIVVIAVGNILTVAAVCRFKRLQGSSNIMIASLAVGDLVMGIVYTPSKILYSTWPNLFRSRIACTSYIFISHFSAFCAVVGLSMLSIERGYAVQFPFHYHSFMTTRRSVLFCIVSFSSVLIVNLPMVLGLDHYNGHNCFAVLLYPGVYLRTLIGLGVAMLVLGFVAFVRVLVAEFRRQRSLNNVTGTQFKHASSMRCRLMCIVYASSVMFWSPHLAYYFYLTFTQRQRNIIHFRIFTIIDLCSSAVNFFIYGFKNSNFRMAYRQMLGLSRRTSLVSTITDVSTVDGQ